jgi:hypothetical protein
MRESLAGSGGLLHASAITLHGYKSELTPNSRPKTESHAFEVLNLFRLCFGWEKGLNEVKMSVAQKLLMLRDHIVLVLVKKQVSFVCNVACRNPMLA